MTIEMPSTNSQEQLHETLESLRVEHRALDELIGGMCIDYPVDETKLRRLKKRKLALRDSIARIENRLVPDIIA